MPYIYTPDYEEPEEPEELEEPNVEMDQSSRNHKKKCCCKKKRSISCATIPSWMNKLLPRSSRSNQGTERIIGGKEAESPIPWQVQFKPIGERPETFCGGTILDKYTILSAAHCVSCREITKDPGSCTGKMKN